LVARIVYSVGPGGAGNEAEECPRCGSRPCGCAAVEALPPSAQSVRVRRERSGRKGKTVTVAMPLFLEREDAGALLKDLKRGCGGGGTLKTATAPDGRSCYALEVQGDHVERVVARLVESGFSAKRAGG